MLFRSFLQPVVVLGGWFSCAVWYDRFLLSLQHLERKARLCFTGVIFLAILLVIGIQSKIYMSQWSASRSIEIGLWITGSSSVFVALVFFSIRSREKTFRNLILLTAMGCLIIGAHGANFARSFERIFVIDRNSEARKYEGSESTQRCLGFLVRNTPESAIIASNMFRIPLPTRDEKYFLLSVLSGRRTFVDGPLYVQIPRPTWLQERVDVSDKFGENPTYETYESLRRSDVSFFVVSKAETKQHSWKPYGETVYEDLDCVVLKLLPSI